VFEHAQRYGTSPRTAAFALASARLDEIATRSHEPDGIRDLGDQATGPGRPNRRSLDGRCTRGKPGELGAASAVTGHGVPNAVRIRTWAASRSVTTRCAAWTSWTVRCVGCLGPPLLAHAEVLAHMVQRCSIIGRIAAR